MSGTALLIDRVFGRLTVVGSAPNNRRGRTQSAARCACGADVVVENNKLVSGNTNSCGCLRLDHPNGYKHGGKSGRKATHEYESWQHAKSRCFDPNSKSFSDYGGRGIRMCDEWRNDFAAFLAHIGPCPKGHTVDRIDTNGNYEPGNVRWASRAEQSRNTRRNRFVQLNGCRMTLTEATRQIGCSDSTLRYHLRRTPRGQLIVIRGVAVALEAAA